MKKIVLVVLIIAALLIVSGCHVEHVFSEATCTTPKTCQECGYSERSTLPHNWAEATCTTPQTCKDCGYSEGSVAAHKYKAATCTTPKTCKECGDTFGDVIPHTWSNATCTSPQKCKYCSATMGASLGHNYVNYKCTRCSNTNITEADVKNILDITYLNIDMNSVGGLDVYITAKNKLSNKTIKYIRYNLSFFNSVNDKLYCEIRRDDNVTLEQVGPVAPGKSVGGGEYWSACFYNSTYGNLLTFNWIEIEYTDGTKLFLEKSIASEAVVRWR